MTDLAHIARNVFRDLIGDILPTAPATTSTQADAANDNQALHKALQSLLSGLRLRESEDRLISENAAVAIHQFRAKFYDENALAILLGILKDPNTPSDKIQDVARALTDTLHTSSRSSVLHILKNDKTELNTKVAIIKSFKGTQDATPTHALLAFLDKPYSAPIFEAVAKALQGSTRFWVVERFKKLLSDFTPTNDARVFGALGLMGTRDQAALRALRKTFRDLQGSVGIEHGIFIAVAKALGNDSATLSLLNKQWKKRQAPRQQEATRRDIRQLLRQMNPEHASRILLEWGDTLEVQAEKAPTKITFFNSEEISKKLGVTGFDPLYRLFRDIKENPTDEELIQQVIQLLRDTTQAVQFQVAAHTLLAVNTTQSIQALVEARGNSRFARDFSTHYPMEAIQKAIADLDTDNPKNVALLLKILNGPHDGWTLFRNHAARTLAKISKKPEIAKALAETITSNLRSLTGDTSKNILIDCVTALDKTTNPAAIQALVTILKNRFYDTPLTLATLKALRSGIKMTDEKGQFFVKKAIMRELIEVNTHAVQKLALEILTQDDREFGWHKYESFAQVTNAARTLVEGDLFQYLPPATANEKSAQIVLNKHGMDETTITQIDRLVPESIRAAGTMLTSAFILMGGKAILPPQERNLSNRIRHSHELKPEDKLNTGLNILLMGVKEFLETMHGFSIQSTAMAPRNNKFSIQVTDQNDRQAQIVYNLEDPDILLMQVSGSRTRILTHAFGANYLMMNALGGASMPMSFASPLMMR